MLSKQSSKDEVFYNTASDTAGTIGLTDNTGSIQKLLQEFWFKWANQVI